MQTSTNPAAIAAPPTPAEPQQLRIETFEHPTRADLRGIEFHFPDEPAPEIKDILYKSGFRFLARRNGQWEPRYYKVQSVEAWRFVQEFLRQHSPLYWGESVELDLDEIPPEFAAEIRNQANPKTYVPIPYQADRDPTLPPIHVPGPIAAPAPEPEIAPPAPKPPEPTPPEVPVPPSQAEFVLGVFKDHLSTPQCRVELPEIIVAVFGSDQGDSVSVQRLAAAIALLIEQGEIIELADDTYALPSALTQVDELPQGDPPMTQPPQDGDFFSWIDDLVGLAEATVAEAESRTQAALWRPTWSGGLYRWFQVKLGIATHVVEAALPIAQCAQEIAASKKVAPPEPKSQAASTGSRIEPEALPSVAPADTPELPAPTAPRAPVAPPVQVEATTLPPTPRTQPKSAPRPRRAKASVTPKAIARHPKIEGEPIFLDDDELEGTERFIGCYAELSGMIGLSFKGLLERLTFVTRDGEYTAMPGTFQPLSMTDKAASRMRSLLRIWDAYERVIDAEKTLGVPDEFVDELRSQLNVCYDGFVTEHGSLTLNANLTLFHGKTDNRLNLLLSLERENRDTGELEKAALFTQRLSNPPQPVGDQCCFDEDLGERCYKGLMRCIDIRGGVLDIDLVAKLTGLDPIEVEDELLRAGHIRREPIIPESQGHRGSF